MPFDATGDGEPWEGDDGGPICPNDLSPLALETGDVSITTWNGIPYFVAKVWWACPTCHYRWDPHGL